MKSHSWKREPQFDVMVGDIGPRGDFKLLKRYICKKCGIKCINKFLDVNFIDKISQDCDLVIIRSIQES